MLLSAPRPAPVVDVTPSRLAVSGSRSATLRRAPAHPFASFHYYGIPQAGRTFWFAAALFSAGLHAMVLLGFNQPRAAPQPHLVADEPAEMLIMPDLNEPEDQKPPELLDDEPVAPSVQVPMLADVPVNVPVDAAFIQQLDVMVPTKLDAAAKSIIAIPLNIQRGRPSTGGMKDLFSMDDLDRKPEPVVQPTPVFPYELKASIPEARVVVGFIVTSKGDVVMAYIVSSTHRGFERAALDAVVKWKFKPGMKLGRKVNTQVEQPINFKVMEGEDR